MSWSFLAKGIKGLIEADTGAGGLFQTGGTLKISGVYPVIASQTATLPYIVFTPVSSIELKGFDQDATEWSIDFDIYTDLRSAPELGGDIAERLRTVLDRVKPTLDSGWTSDFMQQTNGPTVTVDEDRMVNTATYEVIVTKG